MLLSEGVVDICSAEARLPELLDRVAMGEEIVISCGGGPAAKLVPVEGGLNFQPRNGWEGRIWQAPGREQADGALLFAAVEASSSSG